MHEAHLLRLLSSRTVKSIANNNGVIIELALLLRTKLIRNSGMNIAKRPETADALHRHVYIIIYTYCYIIIFLVQFLEVLLIATNRLRTLPIMYTCATIHKLYSQRGVVQLRETKHVWTLAHLACRLN